MPVTLHFQSTGTVPGNAQPVRMLGSSLTVGRSDQNDLVLPDPDKIISGNHCAIEDHDGNIVVIDLSTNGTFLNYGKIALGATPTPINDGDILSIGTYELLVEIPVQAQKGIPDDLPPLEETPANTGNAAMASGVADLLDTPGDGDDFLDDLLGGPVADGPAGIVRDQLGDDGLMPPLGEDDLDPMKPAIPEDVDLGPSHSAHSSALSDAISTPAPATSAIPDDWDIDLGPADDTDDTDDPFAAPAPETAAPDMPEGTITPKPSRPATTSAAGPQDAGAARSFLKSLGAGDLNITEEELVPTMSRLGHVLRMMIHGVREVLMTRASIKSEFRIHQTVISAGGNNPLKFSVSPEQAVEALVRPTTKGYLDPAEAVAQALQDIKAHEVAMMTGMQAALKGVLARLEPDELAKVIETDSTIANLLTNKKARYWDTFERKYQEIADQAENDFHDLFSKEFARAYQEQLERLK